VEDELRERLIRETVEILKGNSHQVCHFVDVLFAYRLLLQRYPEFDDEAGYSIRSDSNDLSGMVRRILQSQEFRKLWGIEQAAGRKPLPDLVVMAEVEPFRFYFRLRDYMIGLQVAQGNYELPMQALMRRCVEPEMNCLDLGANLGFFSVLMASLVGARGSVHSFAPFPDAFALLTKNLAANSMQGIVKAYPFAAHARNGPGVIHYRADIENDNYGSNFVANVPDEIGASHAAIDIQMVRVDDVIPADLPVHFAKIDVEGSEVFALAGMERILHRWHPVLAVELNEYCLRRMGGVKPEDLLSALHSYGYKAFSLEGYLAGDQRPYHLDPARTRLVMDNLVCV